MGRSKFASHIVMPLAASLVGLAGCQPPGQPINSLAPQGAVSLEAARLTLVLPPDAGRHVAALVQADRYRITIEGADLTAPVQANVTGTSQAATIEVGGVPGGTNRVITLHAQDASGHDLPGAEWRAVADVLGLHPQIQLSTATTAVGKVWQYWLDHGYQDLALHQAPTDVLRQLTSLKNAQSLADYALVDVAAWAQAAHDRNTLDLGTAGFTLVPGAVEVTIQGAPPNVPADLWVDDPASAYQSGLSAQTSQTLDRYQLGPVLPGSWTVWASVPGFGTASQSVQVVAGATASLTLAFPGWEDGLTLPEPIGNAAYATDGKVLYVLGGITTSGLGPNPPTMKSNDRVATSPRCWTLDTTALTPAWQRLPDLPVAAEGAVATILDRKLYVVGGRDFTQLYHDANVLDLDHPQAWQALPDVPAIHNARWYEMGTPNGAFADGNSVAVLWSMFFDPAVADAATSAPFDRGHVTDWTVGGSSWAIDPSAMPPVRTPRARAGFSLYASGASAFAVVAGGDKSVVQEGVPTGNYYWGTACVEACDLNASPRQWASWPDLPTPRAELALAQAGSGLYAAGGVGGDDYPTNVVESYDGLARAWRPGPPLRTARSSFGLLYASGRLWALGGSLSSDLNYWVGNSATPLDRVETLPVAP